MNFIRENKYRKEILRVREVIKNNPDNIDLIINEMSKLYQFMKEIAPNYANKSRIISDDYRYLVILLNKTEKSIPLHFILDNKPNIDYHIEINRDDIKDNDEEEIIKYIVERVRGFISTSLTGYGGQKNVDLGSVDLLNFCDEASGKVKFVCDCLGLYSNCATIAPAFYRVYNIYERGNNHVFSAVKIGEKQYVIDLTYSQFFQLRNNNFNRLGIPFLGGCAPGIYMSLTSKRREFAERLMRDGYFEATEENVKLYFDGFAMSYRNGLYYEDMLDIIYETDYRAEDYLRFISGEDNQLDHEPKEFLGRQKKILTNPSMSFYPKQIQR